MGRGGKKDSPIFERYGKNTRALEAAAGYKQQAGRGSNTGERAQTKRAKKNDFKNQKAVASGRIATPDRHNRDDDQPTVVGFGKQNPLMNPVSDLAFLLIVLCSIFLNYFQDV